MLVDRMILRNVERIQSTMIHKNSHRNIAIYYRSRLASPLAFEDRLKTRNGPVKRTINDVLANKVTQN